MRDTTLYNSLFAYAVPCFVFFLGTIFINPFNLHMFSFAPELTLIWLFVVVGSLIAGMIALSMGRMIDFLYSEVMGGRTALNILSHDQTILTKREQDEVIDRITQIFRVRREGLNSITRNTWSVIRQKITKAIKKTGKAVEVEMMESLVNASRMLAASFILLILYCPAIYIAAWLNKVPASPLGLIIGMVFIFAGLFGSFRLIERFTIASARALFMGFLEIEIDDFMVQKRRRGVNYGS